MLRKLAIETVCLGSVLLWSAGSFAAVQPTRVSVRVVACGTVTSILSEKGACYVYDITEGESYLRVAVAVGVRVSGGTMILGGNFKTMLEAVVDFPIGTDQTEAMQAAQKTLNEKLASKEVRRKVAALEGAYSKVSPLRQLIDCKDDECRVDAIRKLLAEEE